MAEKESYLGVQALRGVAASMVVVHHASQLWSTVASNNRAPFWENGAAGVDIFFIISGFVMAVSTFSRGSAHPSAGKFLERRITRVVPLYWLITLFYVLRVEFHMHRLHEIAHGLELDVTPWHLLASLLFIPYRNAIGDVQPLLVVGWTLSFEMFFYALFAAVLAMRLGLVKTLTVILVGLAAIGVFRQADWPAYTILVNPLLLEFLAGVWIGHLVLRGYQTPAGISGVLGVLAVPVLFFMPRASGENLRVLQWGGLALLIVHGTVMLERWLAPALPRWLLLVGDASYSLYLSHMLVFSLLVKLFMRFHVMVPGVTSRWSEALAIAVCLPVAIGVAVPLYRWVEAPMLAYLRRRTHTRIAIGGHALSGPEPG